MTPTSSSVDLTGHAVNNGGGAAASPLRKVFERHFSFHFTPDDGHNNNADGASARQRQQQQSRGRTGSGSVSSVVSQLRLARYFSRRKNQGTGGDGRPLRTLLINPRPDQTFVGIYSPVAALWGIIFLVVPAAYLYIALILLRELCRIFPGTVFGTIRHWAPWLATTVTALRHVSRWVEVWCCLEGIFYILLKYFIRHLQTRDPLEASLSAAPMMNVMDRDVLWSRMMDCEQADPVSFITGWFFDQALDDITKYDIRDFIAWSMYEGRHQEHLTEAELRQLERFVEEVEHRISLHLYGELIDDDSLQGEDLTDFLSADPPRQIFERRPNKHFQFSEESNSQEPRYFSEVFERFRKAYEEKITAMREATAEFQPVQGLRQFMVESASELDFHPVQEFRNLVAGTSRTIGKAEESAIATASLMYESLVPASMDKQLSAMSQATFTQVTEAWNSVKHMKEWLETARSLKHQRQRIRQQLKGYRELLNQIREAAVPSKDVASIMMRITECNEALHRLDSRAQRTFVQTTGFSPLFERTRPIRFAKYSSDPLLGIATYPLAFHMLVLGLTELPLRALMYKRGFERRIMGSVAYYYHPGMDDVSSSLEESDEPSGPMPIVFVHGIGLGLLPYMPLIDALLKTGRPLLLPEIPYVSGFRPFQSPNAVLPPAVVCSTMVAILASHGFLRAVYMGHSYGTSWLSYLCKYARSAVAGILFLDPICFCLHVPYLTKQFVYVRPDPGTVSYMVRTDVVVNWTIQRSFPWAHVSLFLEQLHVPTFIFLSDKDALVPAVKVESYLRKSNISVQDFTDCTADSFWAIQEKVSCAVFRGDGHGGWSERPAETVPMIVEAAKALCLKAEQLLKED